jgi:hypothetical protein
MRQRWLGLGLTLGLLACSYGYGVASLTEQYIAEGVGAMIQYDQAAARLRALQGAFRAALEQAVADMVDTSAFVSSHWQALHARIYAKPLQYIVSYRVLWEYPDPPQKVYRVGVEAEIPVRELSHALDAIGLTRREDTWRIVMFMAERFPGQTSQTFAASRGVVADVLRKELLDQGLHIIALDPGRLWDGQTASALEVGKQLNAKLVLTGWAEVEPGQPKGTYGAPWSLQAKVEVKAFATETSEEIAQAQVEATVPPAEGTQGDAEALAQAAAEIAERLIPALSTYQSGH